jgi:iron-sulfur cluster insertion protein
MYILEYIKGGFSMVEITEKAIDEFKKILIEEGKNDLNIRFFYSGSTCCGSSIKIIFVNRGEESDIEIEKNGLKIFFEPEVYEDLQNAIIDYNDGFTIDINDNKK